MEEQGKKPRRRVKKVKGHGGHHGGAWKVAYADFVTAMMALFLVLWLVSQADTKLKEAIANYFRAPGVFDTIRGGIVDGPKKVSKEPSSLTSKDDEQALFSVAQQLRKQFTTRPEFSKYKEQIKIDVTEEGLRIQLLDKAERVSFASGSAALTPEAQAVLSEIARGVCALPNQIKIAGHTDRQQFAPGSTYTNWELSSDRANAARRALESACVKPEQIFRITGYADTEPLDAGHPEAAANRRISIIVMKQEVARVGAGDAETAKGASKGQTGAEKIAPAGNEASGDNKHPPVDQVPQGSPADEERKLNRHKLTSAGAVSIGEPDRPPTSSSPAPEMGPQVKFESRPPAPKPQH